MEKGNTLTLICNATSFDYPLDELDWFKDGLKLTNGRRLHLSKDVSPGVYTPLALLGGEVVDDGGDDNVDDDEGDDGDYVDLCCCCCC